MTFNISVMLVMMHIHKETRERRSLLEVGPGAARPPAASLSGFGAAGTVTLTCYLVWESVCD